jgi:hydrogenase/urease accessory protein HupE
MLWKSVILAFLLGFTQIGNVFAHPLDTGSSMLAIKEKTVLYELYLPSPMLGRFDTNRDEQVTLEELNGQRPKIESYLKDNVRLEVGKEPLAFKLISFGPKSNPSSSGYAFQLEYTTPLQIEGLYIHYNLLFDDLAPNHTNIMVIPNGEQFDQLVFDMNNRVHFYEPKTPPSVWSTMSTYFVLGVQHILEGYDHLLFLLSLIIVASTIRSCLFIITGFTVAHSITLCLTAMDIIPATPSWVEAVIAASICYVAIENLVRKKPGKRLILTLMFGLVHGMGFAGALSEIGLPKTHFIQSLLSFNLGIEFGQVGVVCIVLPLLLAMRKYAWFPKASAVVSSGIFVVALYWLSERLFGISLL